MDLDNSGVLDGVVLAILIAASVRGCVIGVIREAFSLAALAAACLAIRYATTPVASGLSDLADNAIPEALLPWIAGVLVAILTVAVVGIVGRVLRRGARAVGLGLLDRVLGGVLGAAEGALLGVLVVVGTLWLAGRDHPWVAHSLSVRAYDEIRALLEDESAEIPQEVRAALQSAGSTHSP